MNSQQVRLQRYLSMAGVASRRGGERLIKEGKVSVNGRVVTEMGVLMTPGKDKVAVEGRTVSPEKKRYILLYKPSGYLCALKDRFGRPLVTELLGGVRGRLYHVGRLDLDAEGLLIMTNDGDFAEKLTHPRYGVNKTYRVRLRSGLGKEEVRRLRSGVKLDDGFKTSPARVKIASPDRKVVEITIREGKKRQVKRMLIAVGNRVVHLKRVSIGSIGIGDLGRGKWRELTRREISALKGVGKRR